LFYIRSNQWLFPTTILNAEQKQLVYEVTYETSRCEQAGVSTTEIRQLVRKAMAVSTDIGPLLAALRHRTAVAMLGEAGIELERRSAAAPLAVVEAEDRLHRVLHVQWIDRAALTQACAELTEQFGTSPSAGDVVWSCLNQALLRVPDDRARAQVCSAMARACQCEGRASNHLIKESFRFEARAWKNSQCVVAVEVLWGTGGCNGAARIVEKAYPIDQFIEDPPVPAPDCTQDVLKRGDKPCCNCGIAPVLEPLESEQL
jgi:hypothetical protein